LGYVFTPVSSDSEPEKWVRYDHSLGTSSLESDVSVGTLFKNLSVNMVSTSHMEDKDKDEAEEMIQSDADFWIEHLNTLWDIHFEHRELPTEDKVIQINLRNEANPKPSS